MKTNIHPKYFQTSVTCACGNIFTLGSTQESVRVELCYKCHPFYTGEQRFVDTASRIQKFQDKQSLATKYKNTIVKKKEIEKQKDTQPKTLREMLQAIR